MTTYTTIPNGDIDQNSPVTQPLMTALRDNPLAIAEGSVGAPRVLDAALDTTVTTAGTSWVLNRNAGAASGAVGTYAWLQHITASQQIVAGSNYAGSSLRHTGVSAASTDVGAALSSSGQWTTPSGTWKAMSGANTIASRYQATLFLRIA